VDGNSMICAGFPEGIFLKLNWFKQVVAQSYCYHHRMQIGGADSCDGDSGAPYFIGSGQNATQHGIAIWGNGCGEVGYPG
jgi:hypothetical protein